MGLSTTVASIIIFYVMIVATVVLAGIFIKSFRVLNNLILQVQEYKNENIKIDGVEVINNSDNFSLQINVTNTGNTLIYDFEHCDLIISYTSEGKPLVLRETYSQYPTDNSSEWYIAYIVLIGNYTIPYEPPRGINPTETAVIYANLPSPPDTNTTIEVVFATPKGAKSYYEFFYSG